MKKSNLKLYSEGSLLRVCLCDKVRGSLDNIVLIELPEVGERLDVGFTFGLVLTTTQAIELKMPVAARIVAINCSLENDPGLAKLHAKEKCWIVKIATAAKASCVNPQQFASLRDKAG